MDNLLRDLMSSELRAAARFEGNALCQQFSVIGSEVKEVRDELFKYTVNKKALAEELVDVQMACETMLSILGYDTLARRDIRRDVIAKNKRRGYYERGGER